MGNLRHFGFVDTGWGAEQHLNKCEWGCGWVAVFRTGETTLYYKELRASGGGVSWQFVALARGRSEGERREGLRWKP